MVAVVRFVGQVNVVAVAVVVRLAGQVSGSGFTTAKIRIDVVVSVVFLFVACISPDTSCVTIGLPASARCPRGVVGASLFPASARCPRGVVGAPLFPAPTCMPLPCISTGDGGGGDDVGFAVGTFFQHRYPSPVG